MNDAPRMSPEEADARFAALVAEHRGTKGARKTGPRIARAPSNGTVTLVVVFLFGLLVGIVGHARPVLSVLVGGGVLLVARSLWMRWSRDGGDE